MKVVGIHIHHFNRLRRIQSSQDQTDPLKQIAGQSPVITLFNKMFQAAMLETLNHSLS